MIHAEPGLFLRHEPVVTPVPLLIDVSRSGREYPSEYRTPLPFTTVHDNVSMHLEALYAAGPALGATLLYCCFPNTWVDVNRSELDMDPEVVDGHWPVALKPTKRTLEGLGLIKTKSRYGEPFQERKLTVAEIEERLSRYYRPYHAELKRLVDELHRRFGVLRQISCHCMSAVGAPTHPDAGRPRADFCISDLHGKTASKESMELVVETLESYGYTVSVNDPYVGNELIGRHGDPARGIDSIQVEINKKLFMDTKTFRKTAGFGRLKADLDRLLKVLAEDSARRAVSGG
ncbi:MAG: N-formylglutamate amidohydrolase [Burkholderiales bacterium]|nr:N-formylglutamate amidohydrolase [Burkholderiales bacterium]